MRWNRMFHVNPANPWRKTHEVWTLKCLENLQQNHCMTWHLCSHYGYQWRPWGYRSLTAHHSSFAPLHSGWWQVQVSIHRNTVLRFHYHSQKVIGSLGRMMVQNNEYTSWPSSNHQWLVKANMKARASSDCNYQPRITNWYLRAI